MLLTTWKLFIKSSRPRIILTHAIAKNIPQHQQFVESLAKLLEPIRIPSSVLTFAVIRSLAPRPWDKGGGGQSQKRFFRPLGPQFRIKIRGAGWIRHWCVYLPTWVSNTLAQNSEFDIANDATISTVTIRKTKRIGHETTTDQKLNIPVAEFNTLISLIPWVFLICLALKTFFNGSS